jgi:hypothetical protein
LSEAESLRILNEVRAKRAEVGDISGFLGDILNFFKHLWEELESISAHVFGEILHLVVNGVEYVVQTLREAADALETVFNRIIQGLKDIWQAIIDVINFLKQLFEWDDILLTHQVIKACINSFMTTAVADIGDFETLVSDQFANLESQVKGIFQNLESAFQPGQTFNQFANAQSSNPATDLPRMAAGFLNGGGNALAAGPVNTAFAQHGPRCNYVHSYAKSHFDGPGAAALPSLGVIGDTQAILNLVTSKWAGPKLSAQTAQLQNFVTGKISSPQDFFDLVIIDFLIAIEDAVLLILDGLEDITVAIIQAAGAAISGLQGALNDTIDIPVISWLYRYVITGTLTNPGDDLSILDVLSLIFAVPATILYKVLFNGSPPFSNSPEVQQIIESGLPWPTIPTKANLAANRVRAVRDIPASAISVMGAVGGVANFFGTFIAMASDGLAFAPEPLPGFTKFVSWASVIQAATGQALSAPWAVFSKEFTTWTPADGWTAGLWVNSLVPFAYETVFTFATGALARFTPVVGPVLDTGYGLLLTGISIVTLLDQVKQGQPDYTGWDASNSLVPQLGRIFKFLILTNDTEAAVVAMPLLLVIDLILGIGATVTQIGDAVEG